VNAVAVRHAHAAAPGPASDLLDAATLAALTTGKRLAALGSTPNGLEAREAERRLARYGRNEPVAEERRHPLRAFLAQFSYTLALLHWFAAGLSFVADRVGQVPADARSDEVVAVLGAV
jgi:magnesium-transporting ATPase (P-type)